MNKITVIVKTGGGICDQFTSYAYGLACQEKGFDVYFDTSWYDEWGKDNDGLQVRNYDIELACPNLKTRRYDKEKLAAFKKKYDSPSMTVKSIRKPAYLSGDASDRWLHFLKYKDFFRREFNPVDTHLCKEILSDMAKHSSCAIHVRCGVLSRHSFIEGHGYPCSVNYFLNAIKIVKAYFPDIVFYFFSDGMDFVKEEIIPGLSSEINYKIVDLFGADKGYLDLYMMTKCDAVIASSGSVGIDAKILSWKNPLLIVPKYCASVMDSFENCIFINDGVTQALKYGSPPQKAQKHARFYHKIFYMIYVRLSKILRKRGLI